MPIQPEHIISWTSPRFPPTFAALLTNSFLVMPHYVTPHVRTCIHCRISIQFYNRAFFAAHFLFPNSKKGKGLVLYSAVSMPLDRSKRFTLSSPGRPVHSDTVLGFSWKHSSHAAIAQRLFTHISTTVYSQVLIYTTESTEAS